MFIFWGGRTLTIVSFYSHARLILLCICTSALFLTQLHESVFIFALCERECDESVLFVEYLGFRFWAYNQWIRRDGRWKTNGDKEQHGAGSADMNKSTSQILNMTMDKIWRKTKRNHWHVSSIKAATGPCSPPGCILSSVNILELRRRFLEFFNGNDIQSWSFLGF